MTIMKEIKKEVADYIKKHGLPKFMQNVIIAAVMFVVVVKILQKVI